jgi:APA family basic amino acid/polyamine antiporter
MTDAAADNPTHQTTSTTTATAVVISNMIGAGIFGTTGFLARDLGDARLVILVWVLGCAYSLLGVTCYRELARRVPRSGGEYAFVYAGFGPFLGYLAGWSSFAVGFGASAAAISHLFGSYTAEFVSALIPQADFTESLAFRRLIALALIWSLTFVHVGGIRYGGATQRWLTWLKIGTILALIIGAFVAGSGDWGHMAERPAARPGLATFFISFMFVTFCYSGWNGATYITEEIRSRSKGVGTALLIGTLTVGALYLALNLVYVFALSVSQMASAPIEPVAQKAATALFGLWTAPWTAAVIAVSLAGTLSAMVWTGPRIYEAMAKDGVFPAPVGRRSPRTGTPIVAIVLQSAWVSGLILVGGFEGLVLYSAALLILVSVIAVAALFRPRSPGVKMGGGLIAAAVAFVSISVASMLALTIQDPAMAIYGLGTLALGAVIYPLLRRRRDR